MNTAVKNTLITTTSVKYLRWVALVLPIALVTGSAIAFFLWILNVAIHYRFNHTWLLFLLPLAGVFIYLIYKLAGKNAEKGNNLIIEEIHLPGNGVPKRMGPIILATTVITHLFGGSAGREGTAVQIGGSIAAMFSSWFKLTASDSKVMLTAGIAAGFGAVFGTPLTGAIFALEVLTIGKVKYNALIPVLVSSMVADLTVSAWGMHHTIYRIDQPAQQLFTDGLSGLLLIAKVFIAAIAFGLASALFTVLVQQIKEVLVKIVRNPWLIPVAGGIIIIALSYINGKQDYLSLGVDPQYAGAITIQSAFHSNGADTWSWLWKTIYTSVTLASGFKGGEVTPLFYIGATLGNTLSQLLTAPVSLFAALGFIAVFSGATKTPLACTIMGAELFGTAYILLFAIACFTAYLFSGHSGIYSAQRKPAQKRGYIRTKISKYNFITADKE